MLTPRVKLALCWEGLLADDIINGMSQFLRNLPVLQHAPELSCLLMAMRVLLNADCKILLCCVTATIV